MNVHLKQAAAMILPDLKDKVALITGAGSGIGRAAAMMLAKQGMKVCLVDLKDERREQTKEEIVAAGGQSITVDVDISDPARVAQAFEETAKTWGRLDVVFANAGINGVLSPIEDMEPKDWERTLNVNLKGTFLSVKYAIPHMKERGGSIIITSSINGSRAFAGFGMAAYSTSKAGQVAFMKMAALELARYNIRVNAICPGAIDTNIGENTKSTPELEKVIIPVKYPKGNQPLEHAAGQPEQVADLVAFLASTASSHITGTETYIDGAESLL
ncbi:SDR family NAD(P)-dependent oxidoreductase [Paenibacillus sp. R14(2021)]|uniref:SDR family oxidoreductase n=1 Tax=Paenibacillus sp. R14(2021) TaxID=2859228 RepID=UPI0021579EB3|nr:SDR family NAD(P)-dependent oxidoreductase [Paenibacillus sp. R14(2021)]